MKRLTVLLCTIMTVFTISMTKYGVPYMLVTDAFSTYGHFTYYWIVFMNAMVSGGFAFLLCLCAVTLFR